MMSEPFDIERELENMECPCTSCGGQGYNDVYINEYDMEEILCTACDGTGRGNY